MLKQGCAVAVLTLAAMLSDAADAASVGRCGGNGGSKTTSLSCPPGMYIIGLTAKGGDYLDHLGIKCAPFNAAGKRGAVGHTAGAGGTGGNQSVNSSCSGNRAISSLLAYSGSWVDRLASALCAERKPAGGFEGGKFDARLELDVGGSHGSQCRLSCPTGQALNKLKIRYGAWIDSIEAFCEP